MPTPFDKVAAPRRLGSKKLPQRTSTTSSSSRSTEKPSNQKKSQKGTRKRPAPLDDIDPEHSVAKRRQLLPISSVDPPGRFKRPIKFKNLEESTSLVSLVCNWLLGIPDPNAIPRPSSAPPSINTDFAAPTFDSPAFPPPILGSEDDSSDNPPTSAAMAKKSSTESALYRETIYWNGITLDPTGMAIAEEPEVQGLLDNYILKQRGSPSPLSEEEVEEVVMEAANLLDKSEGEACKIVNTKAFPLNRRGIAQGHYVLWNTDALPKNPEYPRQLSAPKPDRHYGYPVGRKFDWTAQEMAVINHRTARPYTQPARDNLFPFLALEIKSEATGGVLYFAENQLAGSGAHIVASKRWLLEQAFPSRTLVSTDAVAFALAVSPRTAVFYLVWYSHKKDRYVMSKIKTISLMEASDIQPCRDLVNNILDYGSQKQLRLIREALAKLNPVPSHWKEHSPS